MVSLKKLLRREKKAADDARDGIEPPADDEDLGEEEG